MTKNLLASVALAALMFAAAPASYADEVDAAHSDMKKFLSSDKASADDVAASLVHAKDTAEDVKKEANAGTEAGKAALDHAEKASEHAQKAEEKLAEGKDAKMDAEAEAAAAHANAIASATALHDSKLNDDGSLTEKGKEISAEAKNSSSAVEEVKSETDKKSKKTKLMAVKHHAHALLAHFAKHVAKHADALKAKTEAAVAPVATADAATSEAEAPVESK